MHSLPRIDWVHCLENTVRIDSMNCLDWIDVILWIAMIDGMEWRNWVPWNKDAELESEDN